jgi:aminoglycoside phosphotransferase family enzyme/predicted kinase
MDDTQEAVLAFLADPATHGGEAVKRIDTHAAIVILAGTRAFKVKRAVRFPFLDYSTLERRKEACEAELRINRPLAAEIYCRVLPITREGGSRLALGGAGTPIEWAVEMRRFDENATLDHLAAAGRIDAQLADALGRAVAAAQGLISRQAAQGQKPAVEPARWIEALAGYIEEHVAAFSDEPDLFPAARVESLAAASRAAHSRVRALLVNRGQRGLIRRIHGDLHLGNVVLLDGRPVLFDAIEFSPIIGCGDVLYDLAFLLMDLAERGLQPAANVVLNRYLVDTRRAEDLDALAALPLFLSMRAAIRAKVSAARLAYAAPAERPAIQSSARKYFDFACRFIAPPAAIPPPKGEGGERSEPGGVLVSIRDSPHPAASAPLRRPPSPFGGGIGAPVLVAVGGLSGTGKSLLARALAGDLDPAPGAIVLRSDVERKELFETAETEKLPEHAYAAPVTARVYATLADKARRTVAAGHSAVVDAVFAKPEERKLMEQSAAALGARFFGLFLHADVSTRIARLGTRSLDASDADATIARAQESYDLGPLPWARIDASGTPDETLARARSALNLPVSPA